MREKPSIGELILVINDIHNRAIAARLGGDDGSLMLEIEQLAEDILLRACEENAEDVNFEIVDDAPGASA